MGTRPVDDVPAGEAPHGVRPPLLLMVSGGSDSTALLELACAAAADADDGDALVSGLRDALDGPDPGQLHVLHVNHCLRGDDADADEAFVVRRCGELRVPCTVRTVDVGARARADGEGVEAAARAVRYEAAEALLDELCARVGAAAGRGCILTAHTLDDRVETFYMRSLVGTGPGGLASIPRSRGRVLRPLLDATREQLRDWLRARHAGVPDGMLWCEDATNDDGSNFRSRVRTELVPVLRRLRPGFEHSLSRTMDLIASEDAVAASHAEGVVYRNLRWDGSVAFLPLSAFDREPRPAARRILRAALLVVDPAARLESGQIDRVLDGCARDGFATEASGGMRIRREGNELVVFRVQGAADEPRR